MDIEEFFDNKRIQYGYCGRLSELDFLKRIYDLKSLPSFDDRFDDAEGDIWQHTVNNNDYEEGWIFEDDRFELLNGDDEVLLKFLCAVFHPAVRTESGYWKEFLGEVNGLLQNDGYELYPESKISGRDVYMDGVSMIWRRALYLSLFLREMSKTLKKKNSNFP